MVIDNDTSDRTSDNRCDACGEPFDRRDWYPVAFDRQDATIHEFCSIECKKAFLTDR